MDNVFYEYKCPAKMEDPRAPYDTQTQFQSPDVINATFAKALESRNEHDYRYKLQTQKVFKMIEENKKQLNDNKSCQCNGCQCCKDSCISKK